MTVITASDRQISEASGGKAKRNGKVHYARSKRSLTSGVVIRRFEPGTEPPPLHHPTELLAMVPRGQTIELMTPLSSSPAGWCPRSLDKRPRPAANVDCHRRTLVSWSRAATHSPGRPA